MILCVVMFVYSELVMDRLNEYVDMLGVYKKLGYDMTLFVIFLIPNNTYNAAKPLLDICG
jgi:hypothetical protein